VYQYWKINDPNAKNGKVTMHPEKYVLNIQKYKEELWNCIKPLSLELEGVLSQPVAAACVSKTTRQFVI
jgi:hypothetical protein